MNKTIIALAMAIENLHEMAYHRLAHLAGMNETEANRAGYSRAELINRLTNNYKPQN